MLDFFGSRLRIGDVVAFEVPRHRSPALATINAFTPCRVRIVWFTVHDTLKKLAIFPDLLIKVDA